MADQFSLKYFFSDILTPPQLQPPEMRSIGFEDFVIEESLKSWVNHRAFLFPPTAFEESCRATMARSSFNVQKDIVFFIDYLHDLPGFDHFPFREALSKLELLIPDNSSEAYAFLCKCLHFLNCKFKLSSDKHSERSLLKRLSL